MGTQTNAHLKENNHRSRGCFEGSASPNERAWQSRMGFRLWSDFDSSLTSSNCATVNKSPKDRDRFNERKKMKKKAIEFGSQKISEEMNIKEGQLKPEVMNIWMKIRTTRAKQSKHSLFSHYIGHAITLVSSGSGPSSMFLYKFKITRFFRLFKLLGNSPFKPFSTNLMRIKLHSEWFKN